MDAVCLRRLLLMMVCIGFSYSKTLNDTKTLLNNLLANHQKYARPVPNQDDALNVTVGMFIKSIQEFDEVQERFSYVAGLSVEWNDAGMVWDPSQYGGLDEVEISWIEVWTPELLLMNPAREISSLGEKWHIVSIESTGEAMWLPGALLETNCPVNARNFPFDTQMCTTSLNALGYDTDQIVMKAKSSEVDLDSYSESSSWTLYKTSIDTTIFTSEISQINFTFYLKRKPDFVIINIILPILFLSLLNSVVFVLVPESGERVSFCITVLLAIAVFMTIVSDTLPKSSEPVPIISYKLMVDMILSSMATLVTIFNLGIYNKQEAERKPVWVVRLYKCLYRRKKCNNQVCPFFGDSKSISNDDRSISSTHKMITIREMEASDVDEDKHGGLKSDTMTCTCDTQITWKDISRLVDRISLFLFLLLSVMSFVIYILIVTTV